MSYIYKDTNRHIKASAWWRLIPSWCLWTEIISGNKATNQSHALHPTPLHTMKQPAVGLRCSPCWLYSRGLHIFLTKAWPHVFLMALTQVSLHGWVVPGGSEPTTFPLRQAHYPTLKSLGSIGLRWKGRLPEITQQTKTPNTKTHAIKCTIQMTDDCKCWCHRHGGTGEWEGVGGRESRNHNTCPLLHIGHGARASVGWLIAVPRQHLVRGPVHNGAEQWWTSRRRYIKI